MDKYKASLLKAELELMNEDKYEIPKLRCMGKYINLDKDDIKNLIEKYSK